MSIREPNQALSRPASARSARPVLRRIRGQKGSGISGLGFAALVVFLLAGGMVGLLALNVSIQQEQLALNAAQKRAAGLALQVSDRQAQVYSKAGPGELAAAATALGMVPDPNLVYIDLRSGKILGKPVPVTGNEMPALRVRPKVTATAPEATETITSNVQAWFDLAKAATASQEAAAASPGKKGTQAVASPSKPTKQPATNP